MRIRNAKLTPLVPADWAATSGFADMATRAAEHGYTLTSNLSAEWQSKLTVLEAFNGRGFCKMPWETLNAQSALDGMSVGTDADGHPTISINISVPRTRTNGNQLVLLERAYSALKESVYDALVVQRMEAANDEVFEVRRVAC